MDVLSPGSPDLAAPTGEATTAPFPRLVRELTRDDWQEADRVQSRSERCPRARPVD
jgi:hypothetical protein